MAVTGDYLNPDQESDADVIRKSTQFKASKEIGGWYAVVNEHGEYIDASGTACFTQGDAIMIAKALNFYIKAQILNGSKD